MPNFQPLRVGFYFVMTYSEKLKDPRWQKKRLEVLNRDGWACRDCGDTTKQLHVHHSHYERGAPWETGEQFLLTLCRGCHETRQAHEDVIKRMTSCGLAYMSATELAALAGKAETVGLTTCPTPQYEALVSCFNKTHPKKAK